MKQRFLIFAVTGIGNFILKTPLLKKIKEIWPDATIDIVDQISTFSSDLISGCGLIDNNFEFNSSSLIFSSSFKLEI